MRLRLFYHAWLANNWREVVAEQLEAISLSGLGQVAGFTIGAIGTVEDVADLRTMSARFNPEIVHHGEDPEMHEYPTLRLVLEYAKRHPHDLLCYFHTKCVSHPNRDCDWWRHDMNETVLAGWYRCVYALCRGYDVAGHRFTLRGEPLPYFAGNFWWARAEYVAKLVPSVETTRYDAELWVFTGHPKSFDISGERNL